MAWNFFKAQQFLGYDSCNAQGLVVGIKAGQEHGVAPITTGDALGVLFECNTKDGDPVGVITENGARVMLVAEEAVAVGDVLGLSGTTAGYVKKVTAGGDGATSAGFAIAETVATAKGQLIEAIWKG